MTTDPFTHPWLGGLFGDPTCAQAFEADMTLARMIAVEVAFARARGDTAAAQEIEKVQVNLDDLREGTARDGLPVPALVRALKAQIAPDLHANVHTGMTSQDVMDTALVLALRDITTLFSTRLATLDTALGSLIDRFGDRPIMGRTRMQAALPITVADRLRTWQAPLRRHCARLDAMVPELLTLQLGGPVGDGRDLAGLHGAMAKDLDLNIADMCSHSTRDALVEFASWLALVTGSMGKIGQDITLMSQQGIDEITLSGGGGSSAMAHKQNPILAELLVTLAQYNAVQSAGMQMAMVHEQERSGSAWALEWMILPNMIATTGSSLLQGIALLDRIERIGTD